MNVSPRSLGFCVSASVKVREFAEERKAFVNSDRIELLQAFGAKALYCERSHNTAIKHRFLKTAGVSSFWEAR